MPKKIDTSLHPAMQEGGYQQKANAAHRKKVADRKTADAKKRMRQEERWRKARNANLKKAGINPKKRKKKD